MLHCLSSIFYSKKRWIEVRWRIRHAIDLLRARSTTLDFRPRAKSTRLSSTSLWDISPSQHFWRLYLLFSFKHFLSLLHFQQKKAPARRHLPSNPCVDPQFFSIRPHCIV